MQDSAAIHTAQDGRFMLVSERILGALGASGWYSITLTFELNGYETLTKSYTLANSTNSASGEPRVDAGDVPLVRLPH
jgi:hypothetical protein